MLSGWMTSRVTSSGLAVLIKFPFLEVQMSQAIRRYPEYQQAEVINRRIKGDTKGLGYWAAMDARKAQQTPKTKSK